jgi:hypothetical protein
LSSQDWSTRVRVRCGTGCRAQGGGPSFSVGEPLGLGADRSAPAAIELALGALGGELLQLLAGLCRREGLSLDSLELSLQANLEHPLAALGVIGAEGEPAIRSVRGVCHAVSLDTRGPQRLPDLWNQALARAVLLGTWRRACPVEIRLNAT